MIANSQKLRVKAILVLLFIIVALVIFQILPFSFYGVVWYLELCTKL